MTCTHHALSCGPQSVTVAHLASASPGMCRYNFMPLARGTAAVGYITLLGIFLAAGMPITAPIPQVSGLTTCAQGCALV